ncbi:MAG: hypothetical protein EA426_09380 [Spirochaetaceae bacterium]|nr:MAG: hypothetical protein EA426_09380 [Spirochaetaceae bacterium]
MSKQNGGFDEFIGGLAVALVFGYLRISHGWGWWVIFPIVFGGIVPMMSGIRMMLSPGERNRRKLIEHESEKNTEKEVLRIAKTENGVVTPALIAVQTPLSLEEAENMLQVFVNHGYAEMTVCDDGRIEYVFPEFRRKAQERKAEDESEE